MLPAMSSAITALGFYNRGPSSQQEPIGVSGSEIRVDIQEVRTKLHVWSYRRRLSASELHVFHRPVPPIPPELKGLCFPDETLYLPS